MEDAKAINLDYQSGFDRIDEIFEKELAEEIKSLSIAEFSANTLLAKVDDVLPFIPLVIKGSLRTVRYDIYGNEVLIYNINEMQSCIISKQTSTMVVLTSQGMNGTFLMILYPRSFKPLSILLLYTD